LKLAATALVILSITRGAAHAETETTGTDQGLSPSYFFDGGAIPLFWLPALGSIAIDRWVEPRKTPLFFDPHDGGAPRANWENPAWSIYVGVLGLGAGMIGSGDASRWYHVKGLAEAVATSSFVVSALKPLVGRHRPDWVTTIDRSDEHKSFPSGHTNGAFVVATYAALYLHGHVFDGETSGWKQGAAYGGIFLAASLIAGERVYHARHHLSDVMAGALIGSATSYAMYKYQDHRFRREASPDGLGRSLQFTPSVSQESVTLGLSGDF
jgi:membrane-associated phospholipid phosphatase